MMVLVARSLQSELRFGTPTAAANAGETRQGTRTTPPDLRYPTNNHQLRPISAEALHDVTPRYLLFHTRENQLSGVFSAKKITRPAARNQTDQRYRLNLRFLTEKIRRTSSTASAVAAAEACDETPSATLEIDLHFVRSPDRTNDITRADSALSRGAKHDCSTADEQAANVQLDVVT